MVNTSDGQAARLQALYRARLNNMLQTNAQTEGYHQSLMDDLVTRAQNPVGNAVTNPGPQQLAFESMATQPTSAPVQIPQPEQKQEDDGGFWGAVHKAALATPFIGQGLLASEAIADTGPGKAVLDLLSRTNYASANFTKTLLDRSQSDKEGADPLTTLASSAYHLKDPEVWSALGRGFAGEDKTTYSDVINQEYPNAPSWVKGVGGFAGDILLDPLTYVPGPDVVKWAGRTGQAVKDVKTAITGVDKAKELARPAEEVAQGAVEPVLKEGHPGIVYNSSDEINPSFMEKLAASGKAVPPATPATGTEDFVKNLQQVQHGQLQEAIGKTPVIRPGVSQIPAPFKTIEEEVGTKTPKTVYDTIEEPIAKEATNPDAAKLARLRAIKMGILQKPDLRIGEHRVGDLIEQAQRNPELAATVEKTINNEAKRIYREGSDELGVIKFTGRGGNIGAGLTIEQASKLLERGEVPKAGTTGEFTHGYPIHDVEDLDNLYLTNVQGQKTSLRQYLEGLGIKVSQVTEDQPFKFDFEGPAKTVQKKVARTVYESSKKTVKKTVGLQGDELKQWLSHATGSLTPKEVEYLRSSASIKEYETRLSELATKKVAGNFKTVSELDEAFKKGLLPQEAIDQLLKITGAKSWKEFKTKANIAFANMGETTKLPAPGKVERLTERDPNDPFLTPAPAVPTTEEFVKALAKDPQATSKPVPVLSEERLQDLAKVLPAAVIRNLVDPQDIEKYPFLSGRKLAKKTDQILGQGKARNLKGWHKYSQLDVFKGLIAQASRRHPVPGKGAMSAVERRKAFNQRSFAMMNEVMTGMRLAEAALKQSGVRIIAGHDNSGILLSAVDILDSLPHAVTRQYLFRAPNGTFPTSQLTTLIDATESLAKSHMGQISPELGQSSALASIKSDPGIARLKNPDAEALKLLAKINEAMPRIMTRVNANYAEEAVKLGESVTSMTDDVIDNVVKQYGDPNVSMTDAFNTFADRYEDIAKKGRQVKAPPGAYPVAKDKADLALSQTLSPGDYAEASIGKEMSRAVAVAPKAATKVGVKQYQSRAQEALRIMDDTPMDMGDKYEVSLQGALFRSEVPLLGKMGMVRDVLGQAFVANWRHEDLHDLLHAQRNVVQSLARTHRALMQNTFKIAQTHFGAQAHDALQEAFRHLQDGTLPNDENIHEIMNSLSRSVGLMFVTKGGNIDYAVRNGFFASHLNDVLKFYGVPEQYMFKEGVPIVDQTEAWRHWADVEDPLDLLDKVHASMQRASVEVTLGRSFSKEFGSAVQKPGFVKIVDEGNTSKIFRFIDSDLYYPRDIAEQLKYLDSTLKGTFTGSPTGSVGALVRKYDTILHAWKSGVTIYRPGHHIRNLIGDLSLSFFAGVNNPMVYRKALRVMSSRAKAYQGWDGLAALERSTDNLATGVEKTKIRVNGKLHTIDDDEVWRKAFDQGILPDYRVLEDIAFNPGQQVGKLGGVSLTKPFGGKIQGFFGGLSQSRDHYVRLAHFIHDLEKGSHKSLEEAFATAGKNVRKWHPDGSDLTAFERNVMRRIIPFYSWVRKAIPLVVETTVMKPGKAMVFPKAMYNFAVANGLDPNSLSDPFPQDQLFPNFLSENLIGPQWQGNLMGIPGLGPQENRYYGMNPGEPITDIGSTYLGHSPQDQIWGGLTPLAKIPIETQTGQSLGTGSKITDWSEYWDQQIPGVGYLASMTGTSPTGGFENKQTVQKGLDQGGPNPISIINFLTGLGIKDYSKPQYVRRAQFELLDKLKAEHGQ